MTSIFIVFCVGVFVGVLGGIFIIGILQMGREGRYERELRKRDKDLGEYP